MVSLLTETTVAAAPADVPHSASQCSTSSYSAGVDDVEEHGWSVVDNRLDESFVVDQDDEPGDWKKMIVSWDQIKPLFSSCMECGSLAEVQNVLTHGASVELQLNAPSGIR